MAHSQGSAPQFSEDRTAQNLMVVLRHGELNTQVESLKPVGKMKARLGGKDVEIEMAWFIFIGDMIVRFVFDGPNTMGNATPDDLARLGLTPESALSLALKNIERAYGKPVPSELFPGVTQLQGKSPDLDSSYFLDRNIWTDLERKFPQGIVVAVPKRGALYYAPADSTAVNGMKSSVRKLFDSSGQMGVSSALYLFKDGRWSVFQAPK